MRSEDIARLLPDVFQFALRATATERAIDRDRPMAGLLAAMEALHQPVEDALDALPSYFDPLVAPAGFVPYLSGWVDLDRFASHVTSSAAAPGIGVDDLRALVASASELSHWRGTASGLTRFLEVATDSVGFAVRENVTGADERRRDFHLRVVAPAETRPQRALVERVIEAEKPAHMTYELAFERENGASEEAGGRS